MPFCDLMASNNEIWKKEVIDADSIHIDLVCKWQ